VLEGDAIEISEHRRVGRLLHRQVVVGACPAGVFLGVTGGALGAADVLRRRLISARNDAPDANKRSKQEIG
jgi:hypothetical protein